MRLCSIASGSSGNCIYVGSDATHILVDAGISGKRITEGVHSLDLDLNQLDGILITHEHSDHIAGLGVLARKCNIPIYATQKTIDAIKWTSSVGKIDETLFQVIYPDERFILKDLRIRPIRISHDAADPVAYRIEHEHSSTVIMTDLGCYNDYIVESMKHADMLLIEANHDVNMLQVGPYPYPLKRRILGDRGHLSNELCGQLLGKVLHDDVSHILLGHLSKENNIPELAYETVRVEIGMGDNPYSADDFPITVARRDARSQVFEY